MCKLKHIASCGKQKLRQDTVYLFSRFQRTVRGSRAPRTKRKGKKLGGSKNFIPARWQCFSYDLDSQLNSYLKLIFEVYRINISLWLFLISSGKGLSTHLDFWNVWLQMEHIKMKLRKKFNPYCIKNWITNTEWKRIDNHFTAQHVGSDRFQNAFPSEFWTLEH